MGGSEKERYLSSHERSLVRVRYLWALDVRDGRGGGEACAILDWVKVRLWDVD